MNLSEGDVYQYVNKTDGELRQITIFTTTIFLVAYEFRGPRHTPTRRGITDIASLEKAMRNLGVRLILYEDERLPEDRKLPKPQVTTHKKSCGE